jgi:hypothetical protein
MIHGGPWDNGAGKYPRVVGFESWFRRGIGGL